MLTKDEAARIAAAVNAYRPDWSIPSLMAVLADTRCRHRAYADMAHTFTALALDPASKKPTRVYEAGPWWTAPHVGQQARPIRYAAADDCNICNLSPGLCRQQDSLVASSDRHEYQPRGTTP